MLDGVRCARACACSRPEPRTAPRVHRDQRKR